MQIGLGKRWRWRDGSTDGGGGGDEPLVERLLRLRGVEGDEATQAFLHPKLGDLHDPSLLPGVQRAAQRIVQTVREHQRVVIYGDYDVDGVTASAILWHTLRAIGGSVTAYVPDRMEEGYGLNSEAIRRLATPLAAPDEHGHPPLIISVDCGITAVEPAAVARELGVDLIITDHHTFDPESLPEAYALVHPRLTDDDTPEAYACPDLCGAGVAYKLAWQVLREHCGSDRLPAPLRELMVELLSLVALGTVADVAPLTGENRILTAYGLGRIKSTSLGGLSALIDAAKLRDEKIGAYHVGFVLGPRLNACGRMGHAKHAVELLTDADPARAAELATFLNGENDHRRATERAMTDEAVAMVEERGYAAADRRAIVLAGEGWHPGVVGIVASRLVERYSRPVVMLARDNGTAKGSARSVSGVCIHTALTACREHLRKFGGHAMAAGMTLDSSSVDAFREAMVAHCNEHLSEGDLTGEVKLDAAVELHRCDVGLFEQLDRLAPFGAGNPRPTLLLRGVTLDRAAQRMGGQGKHLSLFLRSDAEGREGGGGRRVVQRAVAFNFGDMAEALPAGVELDVAFTPKLDTWQGRMRAELHVVDLKHATPGI